MSIFFFIYEQSIFTSITRQFLILFMHNLKRSFEDEKQILFTYIFFTYEEHIFFFKYCFICYKRKTNKGGIVVSQYLE